MTYNVFMMNNNNDFNSVDDVTKALLETWKDIKENAPFGEIARWIFIFYFATSFISAYFVADGQTAFSHLQLALICLGFAVLIPKRPKYIGMIASSVHQARKVEDDKDVSGTV